MEDYMVKLQGLFPALEPEQIKAIIKEGCKNILTNLMYKGDVRIQGKGKTRISFLIYKPNLLLLDKIRWAKQKRKQDADNKEPIS
jgi:hypothetical protein